MSESQIEVLDAVTTTSEESALRHSMAVMNEWANGEAYDEKVFIERGRLKFREAQEAFFEFGRVLVVLKEHMPHGKFQETVQREFNIAPRAAQKMVQATVRFCSPQMLKAQPKILALGKSKLFELMAEEDEDLQELADGGSVNGLTLDDVDRMTVRELRAALKESREDTEAARQVSADKDAKINALTEKLEKNKRQAKNIPPADVAENLKLNIGAMQVGIESQIMRLKPALTELMAHAAEHGMDYAPWAVGVLNQLIRDIESVREAVGLPQEARADGKPAWLMAED